MGLIGCIIASIISMSILPCWFDRFTYDNERLKINRHSMPEWYKLIYPKWLSFKHTIKFNILTRKTYRHIKQERKRLTIGVMIRNA